MGGDQQLIILQYIYFTLVWCAIPLFIGRPFLDRAFAQWAPPKRPMVSWSMLLLRASALLFLLTSTLYLPINIYGEPPKSDFVQIAEPLSILFITIVVIFTILRPLKSLAFEVLGDVLEGKKDDRSKPRPFVTSKPLKPDVGVKFVIGLSVVIFIGFYAMRLSNENDMHRQMVEMFFNYDALLVLPETVRKNILLSVAEYIVTYVLSVLVLVLVISPLIRNAFTGLHELFDYEEEFDTDAYKYARRHVVIINVSLVVACTLGYFLPLID